MKYLIAIQSPRFLLNVFPKTIKSTIISYICTRFKAFMNVKCWISVPICDSEQYPKINPWYLQIQIKCFEIVCESLQLLVISDAIPGFYVTSQSLLGTFFFLRKLVYDQHYKDVHVYIKQKLNNSARIYSI